MAVNVLRTIFFYPSFRYYKFKGKNSDAFATITEDMLENTWREIDYQLYVLRAKKGAHVDVY